MGSFFLSKCPTPGTSSFLKRVQSLLPSSSISCWLKKWIQKERYFQEATNTSLFLLLPEKVIIGIEQYKLSRSFCWREDIKNVNSHSPYEQHMYCLSINYILKLDEQISCKSTCGIIRAWHLKKKHSHLLKMQQKTIAMSSPISYPEIKKSIWIWLYFDIRNLQYAFPWRHSRQHQCKLVISLGFYVCNFNV